MLEALEKKFQLKSTFKSNTVISQSVSQEAIPWHLPAKMAEMMIKVFMLL